MYLAIYINYQLITKEFAEHWRIIVLYNFNTIYLSLYLLNEGGRNEV